MSGLRLPIVLALAALLALSLPLQATSAPVDLPEPNKEDCDEPSGPAALPLVGDAMLDARLEAMYGAYAGLPGFVDVHYLPSGPISFTAIFTSEVPDAAHDVAAPEPAVLQAIPEPATLPAADTEAALPDLEDIFCSGIRPGSRLTTSSGICTLAFLYTDGSRVYASTAGHCINQGERASAAGVGRFGTAVYSTGDGGIGDDFALIQVDNDKLADVDPAMCDYGGPERANSASILGQAILHAGHGGDVFGLPPVPKAGVGGSWGARTFTWFGGAIPGDSGSGVQTGSGGALGVTTHIGIATGVGLGNNFGSRPDLFLDDAGYGHLTLMTAPLDI